MKAPPNGTYGAKAPGRLLGMFMGLLVRINATWYRRSGGTDAISRMWDFPVVLITTRGARSGLERTSALGGFPDGDDSWLVMAAGMTVTANHPAWFMNMVSNPDDVWLEVGKRRVRVGGQLLAGPEREAALRHLAAASPRYGKYQALTDRELPIVRLTAAK
jgi:deazaflavin-dependent oxidoreductase (nitroreductase family)